MINSFKMAKTVKAIQSMIASHAALTNSTERYSLLNKLKQCFIDCNIDPDKVSRKTLSFKSFVVAKMYKLKGYLVSL